MKTVKSVNFTESDVIFTIEIETEYEYVNGKKLKYCPSYEDVSISRDLLEKVVEEVIKKSVDNL